VFPNLCRFRCPLGLKRHFLRQFNCFMSDVDAGGDAVSASPRAPVQQRLHDGFRADRRYLSQMVEQAQAERAKRDDAVLELKQDLDASSARLAAQSAAMQAREQAGRAHERRTHQSLLDQGRNPYEVARRKVVKREARKERSTIERHIQDREARLLRRLDEEKALQRRREKQEADNRAYERKYQREMGRAAQEERTSAYLLSRTGKEALDPTGKLVRVYPSQETTVKDSTFGLGRSAVLSPEHRRRVVAKVLAKPAHAGTEASSMLLPRQRGRQSQQEPDELEGSRRAEGNGALGGLERLRMPPLAGVRPGQDVHKMNHTFLPSSGSDVKLPPIARRPQDPREEDDENQASSDEAAGTSSTRKKARGRSVLEERQLTKARQRQKDSRFAQPQVVWGKAFTGKAFLANPPTLWFRDFDAGRPLTLSFTLTNVSNTFNQFRLLPMDDDVLELFDLVYEKPGRMSAGMSCSLRMTFTATEARDLDTALSVAAPTGVFQVPVRCTYKKAVPVLPQREVRFPEVVAGERVTVTLPLTNEGALPLEYRVRRLPEPLAPLVVADVQEVVEVIDIADAAGGDDTEAKADKPVEEGDAKENPQDDSGEQAGEEAGGSHEDAQQAAAPSRVASRAASAASAKTSATRITPPAHGIQDEVDPLSSEEQELVDRVHESMRFKPEGADEPVRFTKRGVVPPYSSSPVSFVFAPATALKLDSQQFTLEFPAASSSGMASPDLRRLAAVPIVVSGVASEVPIFVTHPRLDFRCCAFGKLYRHQLEVCNRGKVALKIQVQVPKALVGYVEFHPAYGFVQAAVGSREGKFSVQVQFRPEERVWKRLERAGLGSRDLGMLAVPVSVVVPDQVVPVFFLLTARLTPTTLQLQVLSDSRTDGLHFGACCVGHSVSHALLVSNSARVPQRVGITTTPTDVVIADLSAGVGFVLLPGEARKLRVVYEPRQPGVLKAAGPRKKPLLTLCSSTFNQEYTLQCSGSGVASELVFSHSAVRLGATSLGQTQTCNVKLTNQSERHAQLVELRVPPEASRFLRITPLVARLAPRETVRLEIDFEPTEDIFKLAAANEKGPDDAALAEGDETHQSSVPSARGEADPTPEEISIGAQGTRQGDVTAEPRSCHHSWRVLCFHRRESSADSKHASKPEKSSPLQALEVRTTVVEAALIPSTSTLDFGQVAIGQALVRDLTLDTTPHTAAGVKLRAQPLHVVGAFRLIGALREVPAQSRRAIRIEFEPRTPLVYEDELELSAVGVNIRVRLRGEGINPSLSLTPADGKLDFQDVLARTRNVRELVLANGSAFPLAFSIVSLDDHDDPKREKAPETTTSTGLPVFTFSPTSAVIPENGSLAVQVAFQPDHQRPGHYARRYRVKVPNEREQHVVSVTGRCWENQLYVFVPTAEASPPSPRPVESSAKRQPLLAPRPVDDLFDLPPSISLSQLNATVGPSDLPAAGLRKPSSTLVLAFSGDDAGALTGDAESVDSPRRGKITKTLYIGSTAPSSGVYGGFDEAVAAPLTGATGGSAGSFELIVDAVSPHAKLFTLEPSRGVIATGQQLAVQVTYYPPAPAAASPLGSDSGSASTSTRANGAVASASSDRARSAKRRPELEVVQWVQVRVQCTLKGGSLWRPLPAAGGTSAPHPTSAGGAHQQQKGANAGAAQEGADTRTVTVILRARLET
jgi:hypothetical protein